MKSLVLVLLICALTRGTTADQTFRPYAKPQVSRAFAPRKTYTKSEPEIKYVKEVVIKYVEKPVVKYVEKPVVKEVVKYVEKPVVKEVVKYVEKEVVKYVDRDIIRIKEAPLTPSTYCEEKEGGKPEREEEDERPERCL